MAQWFAYAILAILPLSASAEVAVTVGWKYHNFPLKIELYEPSDRFRNMISKTAFLPAKEPVPAIGKRWEGDTKKVSVESGLPFVLVIRNDTDQDHYFSAAPHLVEPPEAALGHLFECLCNHSVFRIPAKTVWYRIVRINFWRPFPHPKLKLIHSIFGVSAQEAAGKLKSRVYKE